MIFWPDTNVRGRIRERNSSMTSSGIREKMTNWCQDALTSRFRFAPPIGPTPAVGIIGHHPAIPSPEGGLSSPRGLLGPASPAIIMPSFWVELLNLLYEFSRIVGNTRGRGLGLGALAPGSPSIACVLAEKGICSLSDEKGLGYDAARSSRPLDSSSAVGAAALPGPPRGSAVDSTIASVLGTVVTPGGGLDLRSRGAGPDFA
mmetsp:Transcript_41336/g.94160  ORF Transcript_41336/g.94160 Transcript_41336/m.94160 type:complete len:203 (-) Transcript_41336:39-647(-)